MIAAPRDKSATCFDSPMRAALAAALTFAVTPALAACGGDPGPSTASSGPAPTTATATSTTSTAGGEEAAGAAAVRETITALATNADPDLCEEAMTQHFLDQSYPPAGAGALEQCRTQQRPAYKLEAEGVRFEAVSVAGSRATVSFELLGPDVGGSLYTMSVLEEDGAWRVDDLKDAQVEDRTRFDESLRSTATNGPGGLSAEQADCIVTAAGGLSDAEIERRAVSDHHYLPISIVADCVGDGSEIGAVAEFVRRTLQDSHAYAAFADCAGRKVSEIVSPAQAEAFLRAESREVVQAATARALRACGAASTGPPEGTLT